MSSPARAIALDVLLAVERDDAYANLLLPERIRAAELDAAAAAFTTECTYGTARWAGVYDWIISQVAKRSAATIDPLPLCALRLGAHQLLHMRVHDHAAVNETVALVKQRANRGVVGFVNANLRAISKRSWSEWMAALTEAFDSEFAAMAMTHAHPPWIAKALRRALAREQRETELEALLAADNEAPAVQLVALPGLSERKQLETVHPSSLRSLDIAPYALELQSGSPSAIEQVRLGTARVQDAGSQLAALALSAASVAQGDEPERWLDLCAGPGGKAALLAAIARQRGAHFEANEVVPARAGLVRKSLAPIGELRVHERDGREIGLEYPQTFDRILADVPCSGLGALRRRPEARWRKSRADLDALIPLQQELLESAIAACRVGGVIAYVTCSPAVEETTEVVGRALAGGQVQALDTAQALSDAGAGERFTPVSVGGSDPRGCAVQLWPHLHGTDGMFICLLRRTA